MNGKEKPNASFQKFTSLTIQKIIDGSENYNWNEHKVEEEDREFRIWQRDPLAMLIDSREKAEAILEYIHTNPLQEHWSLVKRPEEYKYSSAAFYELGRSDWNFIVDYRENW